MKCLCTVQLLVFCTNYSSTAVGVVHTTAVQLLVLYTLQQYSCLCCTHYSSTTVMENRKEHCRWCSGTARSAINCMASWIRNSNSQLWIRGFRSMRNIRILPFLIKELKKQKKVYGINLTLIYCYFNGYFLTT